jgi:hypothetical protein
VLTSSKTLAKYVHLFAAIGSGAQQPQMAQQRHLDGAPYNTITEAAWLGSSSRVPPLD